MTFLYHKEGEGIVANETPIIEPPVEQMTILDEIVSKVGDYMEDFPICVDSEELEVVSKKNILGYAMKLSGDAYPEYIQALTEHIDHKIEILKSYKEQ